MTFVKRTCCVFCKSEDFSDMFENDYSFPLGNFVVDNPNREFHFIPYNILSCGQCQTTQTKYLGDLNLIYEENFAGAYGVIRNTMNDLFANFILENKEVKNILEIGAGNGSLSESILEKSNCSYTIVDPSYCGPREGRNIVSTFFENFKEPHDANVVVMSHVYEHFYDPCQIIKAIYDMPNVTHIYISFPDLEAFVKQGIYHVLNPEHTFCIENQFLKDVFEYYNFKCERTYYHMNHSVFFEFIRQVPSNEKKAFPRNKNTVENTREFFNRVLKNIENVNKVLVTTKAPIYVWPCSMHTLFCLSLGLCSDNIQAVLDNSSLKIDKYLYGYKYKCLPFTSVVESPEEKTILLTGGCYNTEIKDQILVNKNNTVHII